MSRDIMKEVNDKMAAQEAALRSLSTPDLMTELFKRWDALGNHKDDDFGEVAEVMEIVRERFSI